MTTLFIADIHLSEERTELTEAFFNYLDYRAIEADTLYILGDLFDAWIGDDAMGDFENSVADKIAEYAAKGKEVFLMHGNRDFLMGNHFAQRAHLTILDDPSLVMLGDIPVLITHGDMLCTDDKKYMKFRKMVRNPLWQKMALAMPLSQRRKVAQQMREKSQTSNIDKPKEIMDVNHDAVVRLMQKYKVRTMVQGHTHRPDVHEFDVADGSMRRYVLGDWRINHEHDIDSGWEVRHDGLALTLEEFHLSELAYE